MAEGASPNIVPKRRNPSLCNECGWKPWKYRCPGCSIRSCSLVCVNSHKKRTGCTGKRSHSEVVPLSQFDDNLLLSDYKLLEETKRVMDSARRKGSDYHGDFCSRLPNNLWTLRKAANWRKTCLLFFPPGMSKREKNKSRYNKRKKNILWTIELRFHGTDVALLHHNVDEHGSLLSIFQKHLAPGPWNHKLRPFCDVQLEDLKLFVRKNPKGPRPLFRKLDIKAPIHPQLANIMILEYPVIFIYLPSCDHHFEVEKGRTPFIRDTVNPTCPSGTLYKVEEVEEGDGASDTIITDLMDSRKFEDSNVPSNTHLTNEIVKIDNSIHFTDKHIPKASNGGFTHQLCENDLAALTPSLHKSVDAGFYFDQEVKDAYSDLIGEMNPDDFLCLDGVYDDDDDELGEAIWYDMDESKRDEEEVVWDGPLDQPAGYSFEIDMENVLGESEGNEGFKDLEEAEGNVFKKRRICDTREIGDHFFFSDEVPFGEMELEEGEIPCFL